MALSKPRIICSSLLVAFGSSTLAGADDIEYLAMTEFAQACPSVATSIEAMKSRFIELEWSETDDADIRDVNTPDDIFGNAKIDTAFEVELSNGGYWFGGVGNLKIQRKKAVFCTLTFYGANVDRLPVEADFEVIYSDAPEIVEGNGERRIVKEIADGTGAAIHQQVTVPDEDDMVMFRTFNVMPRSKK